MSNRTPLIFASPTSCFCFPWHFLCQPLLSLCLNLCFCVSICPDLKLEQYVSLSLFHTPMFYHCSFQPSLYTSFQPSVCQSTLNHFFLFYFETWKASSRINSILRVVASYFGGKKNNNFAAALYWMLLWWLEYDSTPSMVPLQWKKTKQMKWPLMSHSEKMAKWQMQGMMASFFCRSLQF